MATACTLREFETAEGVVRASALISNAVLRRALALAAFDCAELRRVNDTPDAGVALMVDWVMRASEAIEREGMPR